MKKVFAILALGGVAAAQAQTGSALSDLSVSGSFAFESEYIFRGAELGSGSFQPGVELGYPVAGGSLYSGIWSSFSSDGGQEVDYYIGAAYPITEIITLDTGLTIYHYPVDVLTSDDTTQEIYFGAAVDVLMSPALYFYYDLELEQITIEASVGYSLDLGEMAGVDGASIDLGAYIGETWSDGGVGGYTYYGLSADIGYALNDNVSVALGGRYAGNNDDAPAGTLTGDGENTIWWGASVSFSY